MVKRLLDGLATFLDEQVGAQIAMREPFVNYAFTVYIRFHHFLHECQAIIVERVAVANSHDGLGPLQRESFVSDYP